MKRLIVTADDVGLHPGMNAGAMRAHDEGIVTACSIVANGEAFEDAVAAVRQRPRLAVGVHLTLVEERPLRRDVPSLTRSNGSFHTSYRTFSLRYAAGSIRIGEVERELRAQIERVASSGITIRHFNGHQHLHLLPTLFDVVQRLALEYEVPYVRIVDERGGLGARDVAISILRGLGRRARDRARVPTNRNTIGVRNAGHLTANVIGSLLEEVGDLTELVCHPGIDDGSIGKRYDWGYHWDAETAGLCDPALRQAIASRGIELIAHV